MGEQSGAIESKKDYKATPEGQYKYWITELDSAVTRLKKWHKKGDAVVNRFLDKKGSDRVGETTAGAEPARAAFSLNLFNSNVNTLNSLLYGNLPTVDVSRKYADSNDDIARVAAETMERLLNTDISDNTEMYDTVLRGSLQDRLLAGLGCSRVKYEFETTMVPNPDPLDVENPEIEEIASESAPIEYFHWRDVLWGWGRNFKELPWLSYRTYLTKDEVRERFGEDAAEGVVLKKQMTSTEEGAEQDPQLDSAWMKAEIWEIWDKNNKKVCWLSRGYDKILDTKEDPLKLSGFYPSPAFFIANVTTSLYIPTPDFHLSQDLYNEIDILQSRIAIITEAVKVVGVYDKSAEGVERMFTEGFDNKLIPVDNWAMFAEKGGIAGQVDWFPITDVVNALDKLRSLRDETIGLLQQVTGMSDIMQGGLQNQYEGVGQSEIKAKFGSVRIQKLQDDFAAFASGLMQIKAEVIAIHFEPKTIAQQSNMMMSFDKDKLPEAIALIKKPKQARLRISIRPESVAMTDFAQLQNERTGYLTAISTFMQSAAPLIESDPSAKPFLLQLLQWGLAGFKGSSEIEGVLDKAIEATQQEAGKQQDKPDPEMAKIQAQQQLEEQKGKNQIEAIKAKAQGEMMVRQQDLQADVQTTIATHNAKLKEINANMQANIAEVRVKLEADVFLEEIQAQANITTTSNQQQGEMDKDSHSARLDVHKELVKHTAKMTEIDAQAGAKITENAIKTADEITKMQLETQEMEDAEEEGTESGE